MTMELNPAQKRYLTSSLFGYERTLRFALQALDSEPEMGILYSTHLSMDQKKRFEIKEKIEQELNNIEKLAKMFNLERKDLDLSKSVAARLSENWGDLIDACSSGLRNYGKLDQSLFRDYDEFLEEMSNNALDIAELFSKVSGY